MINPHDYFMQNYLFSKEDVLKSFNAYTEYIITTKEEGFSEENRKMLLKLCKKFKVKLNDCILPMLSDDWWFYEYSLTSDGFELYMTYCDEIKVDEDGMGSSMTLSQQTTLISVKCDYFTLKEYADYYKVSETTVRKWIEKGKIRKVKKDGDDWLIPSIKDKPKRGFKNVTYTWEKLPESTLAIFPLLKDHNELHIYQDNEDRSKYNCVIDSPNSENCLRVSINDKDRKKLNLL